VIVNVQIKGLIYAKPHSGGGPKRAGYRRVECESDNYNFSTSIMHRINTQESETVQIRRNGIVTVREVA
jgi:hypothetical protein